MSSCELNEGDPELKGLKIFRECDASGGAPCPVCVQHIKLQHKIKTAKEVLDNLRKEDKNLRRELNNNHDPICRVPHEITSLIFQHCIPSFDTPRRLLCTFRSPLVLGAVCRTWRQIAWATPHLWSYVYLGFYEKPFKGQYQILNGWLARSGKLPLSIRIREAGVRISITAEDFKAFYPLMRAFNSYSDRMKDLSFDRAPVFLYPYLSGNLCGVNNLQRVEFHNPYKETGRSRECPFSLPTGLLASPRFVHIGGYNLKCINIIWTNITQISVDYITQTECLDLLENATQLESCTIMEILSLRQFAGPFISRNRVKHDRLQLLRLIQNDRLEATGSNCHARVLERFTLPALKTLVIDICDAPIPIKSIRAFILRSGCALESLTYQQPVYVEVELVALLKTLPSLRKLDLSAYPDKPAGIECFLRLLSLSQSYNGQGYSNSDGDSGPDAESKNSVIELTNSNNDSSTPTRSSDNKSSFRDRRETALEGPLLPNLLHVKWMVANSKDVSWELLPTMLTPYQRSTLKTLTVIVGKRSAGRNISVEIKGADIPRIQRCREMFRAIGVTLDVPSKVELREDSFSEYFR